MIGCLAGWDANIAWKYGLQAESTNLWARRRRPSTARVTSTKASLWSKWSNTETRADWWLFHRRQNCCWGDGEDEAMVLVLLAFDSCTKSQSCTWGERDTDENKHNHYDAKLLNRERQFTPECPTLARSSAHQPTSGHGLSEQERARGEKQTQIAPRGVNWVCVCVRLVCVSQR